jgi:hypothetical protein
MPTADDYIAKIRAPKRPGLVKLYDQIKSGVTPGWDPGKAFEYLIIRAFELEGAKVAWPYTVIMHDQEIEQIDGAVGMERKYVYAIEHGFPDLFLDEQELK